MKRSEVSKAAAEMGRKGGKRRLKTMTPEQRSEVARTAAAARWGKPKAEKKAAT
jgi:hypothetical protein